MLARTTASILAYSLVALFALRQFAVFPGIEEAQLVSMVSGQAEKPYVTRALLPAAVRLIARVSPAAFRDQQGHAVQQGPFADVAERFDEKVRFQLGTTLLLLFLCLEGFALALRRLAEITLKLKGLGLDVAVILGLFLLPAFYCYASHLYDLPGVFLFTAGLAAIAARNRRFYLLFFVLAALNKETALLLVLVWFLVERKRTGLKKTLGNAFVQVAAWAAIRGGIALAFASNQGTLLMWQLPRNLAVLADLPWYFRFRLADNWLLLPYGLNVVFIVALAWVLYWRGRAPELLKTSFWILPSMAVLALLFGYIDEMRVYFEFYPVGLLVGVFGSMRLLERGELGDSAPLVPQPPVMRTIPSTHPVARDVRHSKGVLGRMRGLLGRAELPTGEGMLLETPGPIHTCGMRFPIDVLFLSREFVVLGMKESLRPWRFAWTPGARRVLELPAGTIAATETRVGDRLDSAAKGETC